MEENSTAQKLIQANLIPLDKSWVIRMGVLDIIHGHTDIITFLDSQKDLNDDLHALRQAALDWPTKKEIDVGESGTLYRLLRFASWELHLNKTFIKHGTLKDRAMTDDPRIVNWHQRKLLELDNKTSQWATAAVLLGDTERLVNPPYKLQVTYDAVDHWYAQRRVGLIWQPRYDETILKQAVAFIELLTQKKEKSTQSDKGSSVPEQAEDFCFAYTFGLITREEGKRRWPSLRGHESDRIEEISKTLEDAKASKPITSKDHRVVQAIAMWGKLNAIPLSIQNPQAVNKSWPQFWEFLKSV